MTAALVQPALPFDYDEEADRRARLARFAATAARHSALQHQLALPHAAASPDEHDRLGALHEPALPFGYDFDSAPDYVYIYDAAAPANTAIDAQAARRARLAALAAGVASKPAMASNNHESADAALAADAARRAWLADLAAGAALKSALAYDTVQAQVPAVDAGAIRRDRLADLAAGAARNAAILAAGADATPAGATLDGDHRHAVHAEPTALTVWRSGWTPLMISALARAILALVAGLAVWSVAPAVIGWHPTIVETGSMQPRLQVGDVVVSRPVAPSRLRVGQVLLAADPDHPGRLRMHRISRIRADGSLILRGDANRADDSTPVARNAVRGLAVLRIPMIGRPMLWVSRHNYRSLAMLLAGMVTLLLATRIYRRDTAPAGEREQSARSDDSPTARRRHRGLARTTGAVSVLLLTAGLGLATAPPARATTTWTAKAANAADIWTATPYFTCASAALAANPYLYYQFAESSGPLANDSSGHANLGIYLGGTTNGVPGACARDNRTGVILDGASGNIITVNQVTSPSTFTLETWVKTTTSRGGKIIGFGSDIAGASSTYDRHIYMTNTGQLVFGVYADANRTTTSPRAYNDGTWHLLDATLSPAGMSLYVDGQRVANDPSVTTASTYAGYWRIGYDNLTAWPNAPTSYYFAGSLNHLAVYTTALTAAQIANHFAAA